MPIINHLISNFSFPIKIKEKDFYYKPLPVEKNIYNFNKCPNCNQDIGCWVWQHALANIDTHYDFIKQQLIFAAELFYNQWYSDYIEQDNMHIVGFYLSYKSVKKLWSQWYTISIRKRIQTINYNYLKEYSYYNPNFTIDLNDFICPICGDDFHSKGKVIKKSMLFRHLVDNWYKEDHQQILLQLIGDMLHRKAWDNTCYYDYYYYHNMLKGLFGPEYKVNKIIPPQESRKKLDLHKVLKDCYYTGPIYFKKNQDGYEICPICNNLFTPGYASNHVFQSFDDPKHYELILQMYGDIKHRENYTNDCFCKRATFNAIKKKLGEL